MVLTTCANDVLVERWFAHLVLVVPLVADLGGLLLQGIVGGATFPTDDPQRGSIAIYTVTVLDLDTAQIVSVQECAKRSCRPGLDPSRVAAIALRSCPMK
jgi:hypothetical protein